MAQPTSVILNHALEYVARGWPVFPLHTPRDGGCSCPKADCDKPGKHPRIQGGFYGGSSDPEQVRAWWARWPQANIGIPTGAPSGFLAIDVDTRHLGDETLGDLEKEHGPFPATVRSFTGGGGWHVLFRMPEGGEVGCRNSLFQGIDVKATGGYIVAPPSLHASGRTYCWDADGHPEDVKLADLPHWLLTKLKPETTGAIGKTSAEWRSVLEAGKADGARNASLTQIVGHLLTRRVDINIVCELVRAWNRVFVSPPQPEEDVLKTISSVARREFARQKARGARHA